MSTPSQPRAAISARLIGSGRASGTAGRRETRGWWTRVGFMVLLIDVEECAYITPWSPVYRLRYEPLAIKGREEFQRRVLHWECCSPPGIVLADAKQLPHVFSLSCHRLERCAPLATRSSTRHVCLSAQEDEVFLLGLAAAPVLACLGGHRQDLRPALRRRLRDKRVRFDLLSVANQHHDPSLGREGAQEMRDDRLHVHAIRARVASRSQFVLLRELGILVEQRVAARLVARVVIDARIR